MSEPKNDDGPVFPTFTEAQLARGRELHALMERVRRLPPPTPDQQFEQALSFTYGNLALTTHHQPVREIFWELARDRGGWSRERFDKWANDRKQWAKP